MDEKDRTEFFTSTSVRQSKASKVVDAINETAAQFYRPFGFRSEGTSEKRRFVTMKEVGKLFS